MGNQWPSNFLSPDKGLKLWEGAYTYYVDKTLGDDNNNGMAAGAGHAFKTINKFVSMLGTGVRLPGTITVNIADGDYSGEGYISIPPVLGSGLTFICNTATPANVIFDRFIFRNSSLISLKGCTLTGTTYDTLNVYNCLLLIEKVITTGASGSNGLLASNSVVNVKNCTFSNKAKGIYAVNGAIIYSDTNDGVANTVGIVAEYGAIINKNGTQPAGITAESVLAGGTINFGYDIFDPNATHPEFIQMGTDSITIAIAGTAVTKAITFPTAMAAAPKVIVGLLGSSGGTAGYVNIYAENITATGFDARANAYIAGDITFTWEAKGRQY